ncbi:MAG: hypothetical protein M1837_003471 [Sclerophora amabilis]|nr:MAG: hypothetical protein M1837_003471 [Sclerophora amabilis]
MVSVLLLCSLFAASAMAAALQQQIMADPDVPTCATCNYSVQTTWTVSTTSWPTATVMSVNGEWPPPSIEMEKGQRLRITVENELPEVEKLTLHFHGFHQKNGYISMDGPEHLSQCGVAPRQSFIYDVEATKCGTYWIHSHDPGQYPKGLRSPLVVKCKNEPVDLNYNENDDITVTLSDFWSNFWDTEKRYKANGDENIDPDLKYTGCRDSNDKTKHVKGTEVHPENIVMNDQVRGVNWDESKITWTFKNDDTTRYRFRFINMSAFSKFFLKIPEHQMEVREVDGIYIEPVVTTGIEIAPGQRVSVIITSNSNAAQGKKSFPLIATSDPSLQCNVDYPWHGVKWTFGCITYDGSACDYPTEEDYPDMLTYHAPGDAEVISRPRLANKLKIPWSDYTHTSVAFPWEYNERVFQPIDSESMQAYLDPAHIIRMTLLDSSNGQWGSIDNHLYNATTPPFVTGLNGALTPSQYNDPATYNDNQTWVLERTPSPDPNPVVWFLIRTLRGDHPMHLHGHHFQVLYKGGEGIGNDDDASEYMAEDEETVRRLKIGVKRQMAEKYQFLVLGMRMDNPGVWAMHCHNDFHAKTGMMHQVIEDPDALRNILGTWTKGTDGRLNFFPGEGATRDVVANAAWQRNVAHCLQWLRRK